MLNWDDPLAAPAKPEPVLKAVEPVQAESVQTPAPSTPAPISNDSPQQVETPVKVKIADIPRPAIDPVVAKPIRAEDKRVVNGMADINQLAPFKYPWAWDYFLNANKNHWTPLDVNMTQDIHDYNHKLTLEEKHVYDNVLSYLTTSDILAMRNIGHGGLHHRFTTGDNQKIHTLVMHEFISALNSG